MNIECYRRRRLCLGTHRRPADSPGQRQVDPVGRFRAEQVWFSDSDRCTAQEGETTPGVAMLSMKTICERCRTSLDKRLRRNNMQL